MSGVNPDALCISLIVGWSGVTANDFVITDPRDSERLFLDGITCGREAAMMPHALRFDSVPRLAVTIH